MAAPKLRLVYDEQSYFHLERSEALRVIQILKVLPEFRNWTPISKLAQKINVSTLVAQWTVIKLAGVKYIDLEIKGKKKVIAKSPVILIRKNYTRKNPRHRFLRPTVYIKSYH